MSKESRFQAVKGLGILVAILFAAFVLPVLYIHGMVWFSEKAFPWFFYGCAIAFAICLLVLLPLSIFRKLRPWTGMGFYLVSFLFGTLLFTFSCLVAVQLWGYLGLIIGLVMGGVGVVPVAFLAALFHGEWALLGYVVLGIVVTYGTRALGIRLVESTPDDEYERAEQVSGDAVLNPEADEDEDEDELAESIEAQLVNYEPCTFCGGKGTKEPSGQTCEVCEGSGQIYEEKK